MKKFLNVILMATALLFAGNVLANDADAETGAKAFAQAWEKLDFDSIFSFLDEDTADISIVGFSFGAGKKSLNSEVLEKSMKSMDEAKKEKFMTTFSSFSTTMEFKASKDGNVVTVSQAKGDKKYILCLFNDITKEGKRYKIGTLEMKLFSTKTELKKELKNVMETFKALIE